MSYLSDPVLTVLLCALAYLAGSMLFALPVCRAWHLPDPRAQGSGNPGATNVYRTGGWPPAALTLFLDAAKGWLPVWFAHQADLTILSQAMVALWHVATRLPVNSILLLKCIFVCNILDYACIRIESSLVAVYQRNS